ncbi:protein SLX4IP, partial [Austrofundulus limnaeus]|uniref:Protein SLX4IP n=1 Tax=Austrofundulus limnaeus TaxID=52670 RepID=A0A2I4AKJ5_AUSLI
MQKRQKVLYENTSRVQRKAETQREDRSWEMAREHLLISTSRRAEETRHLTGLGRTLRRGQDQDDGNSREVVSRTHTDQQCGNFAVLVDLHVLPQGPKASTDWFTANQTKEVTALVRDAVDQRVKQYAELLHNRRQPKHRKELPPASAFSAKGENFNLVANFLKRHSSLRCVVKWDLRLFPERYVVCVSCPEDALANHRNPSLAALEQTRSEYFSSVGGSQEFLQDATKTKKSALQKIAKQANVQQTSSEEKKRSDQEAHLETRTQERKAGERKPSWKAIPTAEQEAEVQTLKPEPEILSKSSKRHVPGDDGEDPHLQPAKRPCLGGPPG